MTRNRTIRDYFNAHATPGQHIVWIGMGWSIEQGPGGSLTLCDPEIDARELGYRDEAELDLAARLAESGLALQGGELVNLP